MAKVLDVEFLKDKVLFLFGKRTFCTSNQLKVIGKNGEPEKDKNGNYKYQPKRKYKFPDAWHDEFVELGIIKKVRAIRKKKAKK